MIWLHKVAIYFWFWVCWSLFAYWR